MTESKNVWSEFRDVTTPEEMALSKIRFALHQITDIHQDEVDFALRVFENSKWLGRISNTMRLIDHFSSRGSSKKELYESVLYNQFVKPHLIMGKIYEDARIEFLVAFLDPQV